MHVKCIEPVKRKHGKPHAEWQSHRFPIKGGISFREAWMYDASRGNNFVREFAKGDYRVGETLRIRLPQ